MSNRVTGGGAIGSSPQNSMTAASTKVFNQSMESENVYIGKGLSGGSTTQSQSSMASITPNILMNKSKLVGLKSGASSKNLMTPI